MVEVVDDFDIEDEIEIAIADRQADINVLQIKLSVQIYNGQDAMANINNMASI